MTWHIAPDPNTDEPTLWHGNRSVVRRSDLCRVMAPPDSDELFDALTRVYAPDEATVERLAMAICDDPTRHLQGCPVWAQRSQRHRDSCTCRWSNYARRVLAALAAAPDPDGGKDEGVSE